ncbi:MAG: J domain-containing protein [Epsilonproteobacteria bacterium]|nr:J domain-containing protein [Campylobacterota bacterium]
MEDYYKVLDCSVNDSFEVIRQRYLFLAKQYHPDKLNLQSKSLTTEYSKKFQEIQYAYQMIKSHYLYEKKSIKRLVNT